MKTFFSFIFLILIKSTSAQILVNVAGSQNILHTDVSFDEGGVGVSFYDFDNDGWDDLTFIKQNDSLVLYKNNQGTFTLLPASIATPGEPKHVVWVDYDNDGFNDLLITFTGAPCRLYHNDGNFNFNDVTLQSGLSLLAGPTNGASFGDMNNDGLLDLYLCRYAITGNNNNPDDLNALYKNNGNGTFTNIALQAGVSDSIKPSFQAVWLDYDKDGWTDLYVINDFAYNLNSLYKNNGNETFTNVTAPSGTANPGSNPMSNSVADFDNDGDLDIFITGRGIDVCKLYINNNNGTFTESAQAYNVALAEFFWGAAWVDLDNDTFQDLFIVSDNNTLQPGNYELLSNQATNFINSNQNIQGYTTSSARSVAKGDYNNDGREDIVVSNRAPDNSYLWRNYGTFGNFYIKITLTGTVSNRMAIGSWIKMYIDGECYTKYTLCGENFMGQNSQHIIFGIGNNNMADSIIVIYPSGITDHYYNVLRNTINSYTEGETSSNTISYNSSLTLCNGDSIVLDAGIYSSYLWSNGGTTRYITVTSSGTYWVDVTNQQGALIASDTIGINVLSNPQISINAENISCAGQNNGSILLEIVNQTNDYTIVWNQGLQGDSLFNLSAGNYTFEYNDIYGCYYTDSIDILSPYALLVTSQITPYSASGMGEIYSIINGGTPPYQIYLDGDLQGALIDSLLPGIYNYQVFDANGCSLSNTIEIIDNTSVGLTFKNIATYQFENPMYGNILHFYNASSIDEISVYNALGQLLPSQFENNILFIHDDYKGVIFLKIISQNKENHFKVLKL
jgi:hypothetical protein